MAHELEQVSQDLAQMFLDKRISEPTDFQASQTVTLHSIAISLKRIADVLDNQLNQRAGPHNIHDILQQIGANGQ
jgi:hypothetical protein